MNYFGFNRTPGAIQLDARLGRPAAFMQSVSFLAVLITSIFLGGAQSSEAQSTQTITGSANEGNLEVTANSDGSMRIRRYANGVLSSTTAGFKDLTTLSPALRNGSFIFTSAGSCELGSFGTGANQTPVSNILAGDTITTIVDCTISAVQLRFTQQIKYINNSELLRYKWTITNIGAVPANSLRFFHAHDPRLGEPIGPGSAESASGLYDPLSGGVGVYQRHFFVPPGGGPTVVGIESVTLKSDVAPTRFSVFDATLSTPFNLFPGNPNPVLDDSIASSNPNLGYALEWRPAASALSPGESFVVEAAERASLRPFGGNVFVSSPLFKNATAGQAITLNFRATNISVSPLNIVNAAVTASTPGWTAFVAPASGIFPIPLSSLGGSADFTVTVTAPPSAILGDESGVFIQLFTDDVPGLYSEDADISVNAIPPTPTPTATSTATQTPTPTATATPTSTATPTPPAMQTASPTSIPPEIPLTLTAPLRSLLQRQPVISGRSFPNSAVQVVLDGTALLPTIADKAGRWSAPSLTVLEIGKHALNASATDPLGRQSALPEEITFFVTEGAPLDFDGDGLTDLSRYSTLGNTVAFRSQKSSDGAALNTSVTGAVPAPGNYSGSGVWDFAAISRGATSLTWRIRSTATGQTATEDFGVVGDQPITGCSFVSPKRTSLAVIRDKQRLLAKDLGGSSLETGVPTSGTIIACVDGDGDGIDELVTIEDLKGTKDLKVVFVKLNGTQLPSDTTTRAFDRGFPIPQISGQLPGFAFVRIASSSSRVAEIVVPEDEALASRSISLPRKLVLSSGLFLAAGASPQTELVYQNITKGTLFKLPPSESATPEALGKIASRSFLLIPQYIYKTKR